MPNFLEGFTDDFENKVACLNDNSATFEKSSFRSKWRPLGLFDTLDFALEFCFYLLSFVLAKYYAGDHESIFFLLFS